MVHIDTADGAVRRVAETRAREAVIGVDVGEPLSVARSLHSADPSLLVTVQVTPEEAGRLDRAMMGSPARRGSLRCVPSRPGFALGATDSVDTEPTDPWGVLERLPEPTLLVDGDARILALNPMGSRCLGGTERSLLGRSLVDLLEEADRTRIGAHVRTGGTGAFTSVGGRPVEVAAWTLHPDAQGVRAVSLRATNDSYAALKNNERFLDAIVENIPNMVFVKEAAGLRFIRFNRAGERLLGYARDSLLGRNDYDFFPHAEADFFTLKDREVLAGGTVVDIPEEPIHTREGEKWLHTRKVPILGDDGRALFLLGISEDITARKAAEEELNRLVVELKRSNSELELFASIASHDLQEPLRKVKMFGDRLKVAVGDTLTEDALDCIARMDGAAARMQELISGLLAYSRVTTRGQPFEPVDLTDVVRDVIADLEVRMLQSRGTVTVGDLPVVRGDTTQLRQLFQNLVGNALKFHSPGTPPRVVVSARPLEAAKGQPAGWEISVADEGIGLNMAEVPAIFEPFQRLVGRDRYEGTGMGLAICRRIAERHGSAVTCESAPGKGATFRVRLPAVR